MATVVRVKRRLTDDPAQALVFACKRLKYDAEDKNTEDVQGVEDVESVFKFAGTVKDQKEPILPHITRAIKLEELRNKGVKRPNVAIATRCRDAQKSSSKRSRYQLVNACRSLDLAECKDSRPVEKGPPELTTDREARALFRLYDVIEETGSTRTTAVSDSNLLQSKKDEISCNGVAMARVRADVESPSNEDQYVYDLYYTSDFDIDDLVMQHTFRIEKCSMEADFTSYRDDSEFCCEEDEDSNDEDYYKNDYPEEDADFEKGYDCWCDYEEADEEALKHLAKYRIEDSSEDEFLSPEAKPSETDIYLHGEHYARYKAEKLAESDLDCSDDKIDNEEEM